MTDQSNGVGDNCLRALGNDPEWACDQDYLYSHTFAQIEKAAKANINTTISARLEKVKIDQETTFDAFKDGYESLDGASSDASMKAIVGKVPAGLKRFDTAFFPKGVKIPKPDICLTLNAVRKAWSSGYGVSGVWTPLPQFANVLPPIILMRSKAEEWFPTHPRFTASHGAYLDLSDSDSDQLLGVETTGMPVFVEQKPALYCYAGQFNVSARGDLDAATVNAQVKPYILEYLALKLWEQRTMRRDYLNALARAFITDAEVVEGGDDWKLQAAMMSSIEETTKEQVREAFFKRTEENGKPFGLRFRWILLEFAGYDHDTASSLAETVECMGNSFEVAEDVQEEGLQKSGVKEAPKGW